MSIRPSEIGGGRDATALQRSAVTGGILWVATELWAGGGLSVLERLWALGAWVVVPLAVAVGDPRAATTSRHVGAWLLPLAAALAVVSLTRSAGTTAALGLAAPWGAIALWIAARGRNRLKGGGLRSPAEASAGVGLLTVGLGGLWLGVHRLGATPLGLDSRLVLVTSVHFHFATVVPPVLAAATWRRLEGSTAIRWAVTTFLIGGPIAIALGYTAWRPLGLAGTVLLTAGVGVWGMTALGRLAPRLARPASRALLVISVFSAFTALGLAVLSSWGAAIGPVFLPPAGMTRMHGPLQALGFSLAGLLAFALDEPRA